MLLYYCVKKLKKNTLEKLRKRGRKKPKKLWTAWEAAEAACTSGTVLVVEKSALKDVYVPPLVQRVTVPSIPPSAFLNLDPYLPVRPVIAGGGYVMRKTKSGPEVLMIFRRGVWDLPKGKQDPGETPEACALREVKEEVGIKKLKLIRPLGRTRHGYPEAEAYRVKTTHWYLMSTPEASFTPQAKEQIEKVEWVPWEKAKKKVAFENLRIHMEAIAAEGWLP